MARNQTTSHKTTNNITPYSDDEITKKYKKTLYIRENHLFKSKEKEEKKMQRVILVQNMT